MAAAMVSLNMAAAVPVATCAVSRGSNMSSSASLGGVRLDSATAAAPGFSRSSRPLVVCAGEKPSLWESITSAFGAGKKKVDKALVDAEAGKKKVDKALVDAEKELNKAASEAKSASGDLRDEAEGFKKDAQTQADSAAKEVKAGVEDLNTKVEEAVEAAQKN